MTVQSVTLTLTPEAYESIKRAADRIRRPVDEVLSDAVVAAMPVIEADSRALSAAFAHMAYLNDAILWQLARSSMSPEQSRRLEQLHHKLQRSGLTHSELAEEDALSRLYEETILVRAQAAVLLKQRGYDVHDPTQFEPM